MKLRTFGFFAGSNDAVFADEANHIEVNVSNHTQFLDARDLELVIKKPLFYTLQIVAHHCTTDFKLCLGGETSTHATYYAQT